MGQSARLPSPRTTDEPAETETSFLTVLGAGGRSVGDQGEGRATVCRGLPSRGTCEGEGEASGSFSVSESLQLLPLFLPNNKTFYPLPSIYNQGAKGSEHRCILNPDLHVIHLVGAAGDGERRHNTGPVKSPSCAPAGCALRVVVDARDTVSATLRELVVQQGTEVSL